MKEKKKKKNKNKVKKRKKEEKQKKIENKIIKKKKKKKKERKKRAGDDLTDSVELQVLNWRVGGVAGSRREGGKEVKKFLIRETVKIQYENK